MRESPPARRSPRSRDFWSTVSTASPPKQSPHAEGSRSDRLEARGLLCGGAYSRRALRGKIHSSHGGRKAYLNFELKDHGPNRSRLLPRSALKMSKSDKSDFDWRRHFVPSLTSKFRHARVCRAMNGKVWPERPFSDWWVTGERPEVLSRMAILARKEIRCSGIGLGT